MLIDYSYKYFYADGYGKDSLILNLDDKGYDKDGDLYFTACLLSFYQQLWLWDTHRDKIRDFNIEKPLWVFVGNTVAGEDSDILEVIRFLAWFLNHPKEASTWIADLVADKARLLDSKGNDIFARRFTPLIQRDAVAIYDDILKRLFNADARQRLKLVNLRNSKGELALRVRNADNRAKGLGFALAGNFYPDFLLWLVDDESGKQWLSFVDPKGILKLNLSDPKFGLYREIKQIEAQLADKAISLSAFILSITSFHDLINLPRTTTKSDLEERNVLFMDDGGPSYLRQLITKARA